MTFKRLAASSALIALAGFSSPAIAQITEIRVGVSEFDAQTVKLNIGRAGGNETSAALNAEILFAEPEFLKWALTPQPYIGGTLNLEGNTSYAGAGLMWRQTFGDKFYGDFAFGLVIHDGTTTIDRGHPGEFDAFLERFNSEIQLGSRVLFREQLSFGYRFTDEWSAEIFGEHLSNGKILASVNQGVDIIGAKVSKRF